MTGTDLLIALEALQPQYGDSPIVYPVAPGITVYSTGYSVIYGLPGVGLVIVFVSDWLQIQALTVDQLVFRLTIEDPAVLALPALVPGVGGNQEITSVRVLPPGYPGGPSLVGLNTTWTAASPKFNPPEFPSVRKKRGPAGWFPEISPADP